MRLIDADTFVKSIENENSGMSISGTVEKLARTIQVNMQPTVNAVPVEWIKKWAKKNGLDCYDYDYPTEKNEWWYAIEKMLEDWEKENGKDI